MFYISCTRRNLVGRTPRLSKSLRGSIHQPILLAVGSRVKLVPAQCNTILVPMQSHRDLLNLRSNQAWACILTSYFLALAVPSHFGLHCLTGRHPTILQLTCYVLVQLSPGTSHTLSVYYGKSRKRNSLLSNSLISD